MATRRHQQADQETELDLTPMLDVVFIMLIFFIVTTSFVKESGIAVNTPKADTAQRQESANILIAIHESGDIWIDGRPIDVRALKAKVARMHAESPQGTVVVQSDERADTGILVKVMDQIRLAGIDQIAIAARPGAQ
ncbi:MAG: biopolymer transporter ExbD [Ketobacter sp.]|nr:MAG: biopolymer transporter ExbD [Ketobacter sp.]